MSGTFNSWVDGLGASEAAAASGSLDFFSDTLALPSVIATIMIRPTSPLFSAFNPTLTALKQNPQCYPDYRCPGTTEEFNAVLGSYCTQAMS